MRRRRAALGCAVPSLWKLMEMVFACIHLRTAYSAVFEDAALRRRAAERAASDDKPPPVVIGAKTLNMASKGEKPGGE